MFGRLIKKLVKFFIELCCWFTIFIGAYLAQVVLFAAVPLVDFVLGMFVIGFANMFLLLIPCATIILIKLKCKKIPSRKFYAITIIGIVITTMFAIPIASYPWIVQDTEAQFQEMYGADYMDGISSELQDSYYQKNPYSITDAYYGIHPVDAVVVQNITYTSVQRPFTSIIDDFMFDVYLPLETANSLFPIHVYYPTIVHIHGGGWKQGDKGGQPNLFRYLASRGYVVFDLQYGLSPEGYNMTDIISQLATFTRYLNDNYKDYHADLSKVFFTGGSAGGHLSLTMGLGYQQEYLNHSFGQNIKVAGIFPFFPPVNMKELWDIYATVPFELSQNLDYLMNGTPTTNPTTWTQYNPIELVSTRAPPILLLQGGTDLLVDVNDYSAFVNTVKNKGGNIAFCLLPFAAHAYSWTQQDPHMQISMYFIERFLALNS